MELDQWKHQLNLQLGTNPDLSVQQIGKLLEQRAGSAMSKIGRSLKIEITIAVLVTVACIVGSLLIHTWSYRVVFAGFAVAGLVLSAATYALARKTKRVISAASAVKENVASVISIISQYTQLYLRAGIALLPVCYLIGFWLSYNDPAAGTKPVRWDVFGWMSAAVFVAATLSYFFTRWYLEKLYGNHLRELRRILNELQD